MTGLYATIVKIDDNRVTCCVETGVLLFVYKYLSCENTQAPPLYFVINGKTRNDATISIDITDFKFTVKTYDEIENVLKNCYFPSYSVNEYYCIAGFCAVLRQIVNAFDNDRWLLGFREATLSACAEFSIWTKFCEVDLITAVEKILACPCTKIPEDFVRLEHHFLQPIRTHNIGKKYIQRAKQTGITTSSLLEHSYVEGSEMYLPDLIIFPLIHISSAIYGWENLHQYLPLICKWYELMLSEPRIQSSLSIFAIDAIIENQVLILPEVKKESLYNRDPHRYKPERRIFTKQEDVEKALEIIDSTDILSGYYYDNEFTMDETFTWDNVPFYAHPKGGSLPDDRLCRKMHQIENVVKSVLKISKKGDIIVDFCCGGGHVGILLAYLLPDCFILLLDNREHSLWKVYERICHLNLKNVHIIQSNIDYFKGDFQIGVSLHACGVATDLVINKCIQRNSKFVVAPCCYGKLQQNHMLCYPKSKILRDAISVRDYMVVGHCADQTHSKEYSKSDQGEKCMKSIDVDRCLHAEEHHYKVHLAKMIPVTCSPKNNLIIGIPA